jgi:mRNA interferase MazF
MTKQVTRGDVLFADLSPVVGSEQGGVRPVLVIQNNAGNTFAPTTIIAPISSVKTKRKLPTHISVTAEEAGVSEDSIILAEQIRTIDKSRLREKVGRLSANKMLEVDRALMVSLALK